MNRKKYEDGIQYIADAYGLGNQREKLIEELSELLVAVTHDDRGNIAEEMADVRIMIDQVAYLMDIRPAVDVYVKSKIDRTLHEMDGWCRRSQVVARWLQKGKRMKKLKLYIETQGNGKDIRFLLENSNYNSASDLFYEIKTKINRGDKFVDIDADKKNLISVRTENIVSFFVEETEV